MKHDIGGIPSFVIFMEEAQNNEGDYGNHYHRSKPPRHRLYTFTKAYLQADCQEKHSSAFSAVIREQSASAVSYHQFSLPRETIS